MWLVPWVYPSTKCSAKVNNRWWKKDEEGYQWLKMRITLTRQHGCVKQGYTQGNFLAFRFPISLPLICRWHKVLITTTSVYLLCFQVLVSILVNFLSDVLSISVKWDFIQLQLMPLFLVLSAAHNPLVRGLYIKFIYKVHRIYIFVRPFFFVWKCQHH